MGSLECYFGELCEEAISSVIQYVILTKVTVYVNQLGGQRIRTRMNKQKDQFRATMPEVLKGK